METWLNSNITDSTIDLTGYTAFQSDRTADSSESCGGGLSIYVSNSWSSNTKITERYCCADLELLMVPDIL